MLETNKRTYVFGEPVIVTALLENVATEPIYVGRHITDLLSTSTDHDLLLRVYEGNGREVRLPTSDAAGGLPNDGEARAQAIRDSYLLLYPGALFGARVTVPVRLEAGTYTLVVGYREFLASSLAADDVAGLHFAIQMTPLSRSVRIRVVSSVGSKGPPN